jgi:hypothetical protein
MGATSLRIYSAGWFRSRITSTEQPACRATASDSLQSLGRLLPHHLVLVERVSAVEKNQMLLLRESIQLTGSRKASCLPKGSGKIRAKKSGG